MNVTVWDVVVRRLQSAGVRHVFGLPGDDMAILRAFEQIGMIVHIGRDQRHSVYQAAAYARLSGGLGVVFVGKGPAVTHCATGLLEARAQGVPVLLISSGVGESRLGTGAFQELDALPALAAHTMHRRRLNRPDDAAEAIDEMLWRLSLPGSGPGHLEVPEDIGLSSIQISEAPRNASALPAEVDLTTRLDPRAAIRPVILVGGGCQAGGHDLGRRIEALAEQWGAALVCTASGRGVIDEDHPQFLGLSGLYAPTPAATLLAEADLIVGLGTALEETAVHGWPDPAPPVLQVDINPRAARRGITSRLVVADVTETIMRWGAESPSALGPRSGAGTLAWVARIRQAKAAVYAAVAARAASEPSTPGTLARVADVLRAVDAVVPHRRVSVHENGLADIWSYCYPYWQVRAGATCIVPSEQTPLGFGVASLPAVAAALPHFPVVGIIGDGALDVTLAELPALSRITTPTLLVVLRNGGYGWLEANGAAAGAQWSFLDSVDHLAGSCAAAGIAHVACATGAELAPAVEDAWAMASQGCLVMLDVRVDLADAPPGMDDLAGDFPAPPAEGDSTTPAISPFTSPNSPVVKETLS